MNNLSYYLARIYYALTRNTTSVIPSGYQESWWSERIYRHLAGFPDRMSGGKNTSFWLELAFYKKTNQTHRLATGTYPAWFWLSKLYAFYAGQNTNVILQPASASFWAEKLVNLSTFEAPVMAVFGNGVLIANGDSTPSTGDHTDFGATDAGTTVSRTYTIQNTGNANLTGVTVSLPMGFTLTSAPSGTIAASGSSTFTMRLDAGVTGTKSGNITIDSVELADYVFAISGIVRTYVQKLVAQVPIQLLALSETSGTNADDSGTGNLDGTYNGGITLNAATFTDGTPAPLFNGIDGYVAAFSAGLASVFSLSAGTLAVWWKMDADKWEDLVFHFFAGMTIDINNRFQILKDTGSKTLRCDWIYGGVVKTVTYVIPVTPTGWVHIAATYTGGTLRLYLNGVEVGTAATGGGSMTGTLTVASIGRHFSSAFYAPGNAKYRGYWNTGLSAAEILRQVAVP